MNGAAAVRQQDRTAAWHRVCQCLPITPHA